MSNIPMNKASETNWERIDSMADEEIDTSDIPPLTEDFFKRAKIRMPKGKIAITMGIDYDVDVYKRQPMMLRLSLVRCKHSLSRQA